MYVRLTRKRVLLVTVLVGLVAAVGVGYAAIPNDAHVFNACMLRATGTVRLVDSTLPSTSLLSHCTSLEQPISWNQQGQAGKDGTNGTNGAAGIHGTNGSDGSPGANGTNGQSVMSATEGAGTNCADGGSKFTAANGVTYACNGAKGDKGDPGTNGTNGAPGKDGADGAPCLPSNSACVGPPGQPGSSGGSLATTVTTTVVPVDQGTEKTISSSARYGLLGAVCVPPPTSSGFVVENTRFVYFYGYNTPTEARLVAYDVYPYRFLLPGATQHVAMKSAEVDVGVPNGFDFIVLRFGTNADGTSSFSQEHLAIGLEVTADGSCRVTVASTIYE